MGSTEVSPTLTGATTSAVVSADESERDSDAWRQELAARLNRYHSRRKPRPPRYPSLRLKFEQETVRPSDSATEFSCAPQLDQAIAVNGTSTYFPVDVSDSVTYPITPSADQTARQSVSPAAIPSGKIIEFPRSWAVPAAQPDELAGPVVTAPRILEAPEVAPPPPALGGITIEPSAVNQIEKRPGIDIPLQAAALERRLLAGVIDSALIVAACAAFAFIFWKMTAIRPPRAQIIGVLTGLATLFWAGYQYLLVVYAGTTPGLRLARLDLSRFDGTPVNRRLRRWRVLASFLSAASLGMGYGWIFLDEDSLCWHDRITHTYLARGVKTPKE